MNGDTAATAVASAGLALVGKIVFDWLSGKRQRGGNGSSGDKEVGFWKETIRDLMREELRNFEERRSEKIREIINDAIRDKTIERRTRDRG